MRRHMMNNCRPAIFLLLVATLLSTSRWATAQESDDYRDYRRHWLWSIAHEIPKETTTEGSGYFSIIEGHDGNIYIGAAKYRHNAYLVEFDPETTEMEIVLDAQHEIGTDATGFAAQAKFHTRNNIGESGRIYLGTKQGYPAEDETRDMYPGGYPMVFDPETGETRVYPIPIPHQGIISMTPDESRGLAYISTCDDGRPIESSHFMILDLETEEYRDLMETHHMYAFIVVDDRGRAYHPILGGDVARYDPDADRLDRLTVLVDGAPPTEASLLAHPESHPLNWDITPDRQTFYCVAMSGNQLYSFDLAGDDTTLHGRSLGPIIPGAQSTDCRAMCVGPDGTVWAGVAATFEGQGQFLHLSRYRPGVDAAPVDLGPIAISNPDYTEFVDGAGEALPWHHGVHRPFEDGPLLPRYTIMGICASADGRVYVTTLAPFTLHEIRLPHVAGVTSVYHHNAHADVLLSRLMQTDTLDGAGEQPTIAIDSLYVDQVPESDISRRLSAEHDVPIYDNVAGALLADDGTLAVDGIMLVAEHGDYPRSETGQIIYPKRRLFEQVADVVRQTGQPVPVFVDKHLADNWEDAHWLYSTARELDIPLMAGSSLPTLWRYPPTDVRRGESLKEIVAVSYHTLDAYGFHALEMVQCLAERRAGGETGISSVQCITGPAVWTTGLFDRALLDECIARLRIDYIPEGQTVESMTPEPILFHIRYADGLVANVLTLNGAVGEWSAAWRYADDSVDSTLFWTQEARPFMHFTYQLAGIEQMYHTGVPTWPVERTLMTSGVLDALLISKLNGGNPLDTPQLIFSYQSDWNWHQPPDPPPGRPVHEQ